MTPLEKKYRERIGFNGDLTDISKIICKEFGLGDFLSCEIVFIGYEDFNLSLKSSKSNFFVKIFSTFRTLKDCRQIVGLMEEALKKKISIPKLFKSAQGYLHTLKTNGESLRLCVMEFISGKDLFTSKLKLNYKDIRKLAKQTALINQLPLKPPFIYDSWAIVNFSKEFKEKSSVLNKEDLLLITPLLSEVKKLDFDSLPRCFAHGDIISTNLLKGNKDNLWIIDFSCSNYYPRIQELAVIACDILFDPQSKKNSEKNFSLFLKEYHKTNPLTNLELKTLPLYIQLAHAMHLLRANYEKRANNNLSLENKYFLELGRAGLKQLIKK